MYIVFKLSSLSLKCDTHPHHHHEHDRRTYRVHDDAYHPRRARLARQVWLLCRLLVGDTPHRAIPTAQDNLRSGLCSLRRSMSTSSADPSKSSPASLGRSVGTASAKTKRIVGYAWVSVAADVNFEGEDVRDSLGAVVRMAEDGWLRPWVGGGAAGAPPGAVSAGEARAEVQSSISLASPSSSEK